MKLGIYEILEKADKEPIETKADVLNANMTTTLYKILELMYAPTKKWLITGKVEYKPSQFLDMQGSLPNNIRYIERYFLEDPLMELTEEKRHKVYCQFLENLDKDDARLIESIRLDKPIFKSLTTTFMKKHFPVFFPAESTSNAERKVAPDIVVGNDKHPLEYDIAPNQEIIKEHTKTRKTPEKKTTPKLKKAPQAKK